MEVACIPYAKEQTDSGTPGSLSNFRSLSNVSYPLFFTLFLFQIKKNHTSILVHLEREGGGQIQASKNSVGGRCNIGLDEGKT